MERPRIKLGSPLPKPPTKPQRSTVDDLLHQFGSRKTSSSVTKALRQSSLKTVQVTTKEQVISLAVSKTTSPVTSPPTSLLDDSSSGKLPAQNYESAKDAELPLNLPERRTSARHSLRSAPQKIAEPTPTPHPRSDMGIERRTSSRLAKVILTSDTTPSKAESNAPPKTQTQTARSRIRSGIESTTKVKQDNYLVEKKDYFLPLLPPNNYISKLVAAKTKGSITKYKALAAQPKGIIATMKSYQLDGLSFLVHLYENGMSGMLGDEMGLGKTLQTLSLFQYIEELEEANGTSSDEIRPYLVVCPLSVLSSWVSEANKWTPNLKVLRFHGPVSERTRLKRVAAGIEDRYGNETIKFKNRKREPAHSTQATSRGFNIVVTTYDTFASEKSWFKTAFVWRYVVLDEGHKIKNDVTQISTALQGLQAEYRLILTGTPLQNNLHEMWALLHWLYPHVFTDKSGELFRASFDLSRGKVNTSVMDDARRLLELIMLRRMKDTAGVNLGLPPKAEILLFVPLSPMQRFWYTRLLTRAGDGLLDDLFKDVKSKEKITLQVEAEENEQLAKLESLENVKDQQPDQWQESREIMRQALEQEQAESSSSKIAWQRLMNLVMQLRKCCSHPYLLPNAIPEPYQLGEHVVLASGKFIVLEKLVKDLVITKGKKILIFSSFTKVLDCCEDLLHLVGGDGTNFRYLRLEGTTARARRNLAIRMFNDMSSDYKVMLISVRAGGLGINLTSASDVIFIDEDWNPQITLQAEARAHRIGQTKPVTIYKLCTQGTVEEQMMGRIRKKLYLSAKITESMRSVHNSDSKSKKRGPNSSTTDMPQLGVSQLKTLVRRGAQTLSHPEIDITEMLSWDLSTIIEKCRDKPSDPHVGEQSSSDVDEEKWLSVMERVECAVFDGKRYQRNKDNENYILSPEITREDRRKGKNTTVLIDGYAVSKESVGCADWEAVPTMAGKDPSLASPKRAKKAEINNQEHCHICFDGGSLVLCSGCPRSYHANCLKEDFKTDVFSWRGFFCPQHECYDCSKKTSDAGGVIFRCRWCPRGYCEDCLQWDKTTIVGEQLLEYDMLGHPLMDNAFYIVCPNCNDLHAEDPASREFIEKQMLEYKVEHQHELARRARLHEEEMVRRKEYEAARAEAVRQRAIEKAGMDEEEARKEVILLAEQPFRMSSGVTSVEPPELTGDSSTIDGSGVATPRTSLRLRSNADPKKRTYENEPLNVEKVDVALAHGSKRMKLFWD